MAENDLFELIEKQGNALEATANELMKLKTRCAQLEAQHARYKMGDGFIVDTVTGDVLQGASVPAWEPEQLKAFPDLFREEGALPCPILRHCGAFDASQQYQRGDVVTLANVGYLVTRATRGDLADAVLLFR